ncbi:hypothetical protein BGZ76_011892 [Entomortierella beljakovae]|nr:hypothetical protein BGZ76_011892 [Entomortierella beljakovae]
MLAGDRPNFPKTSTRYSFHGESSTGQNSNSRVKTNYKRQTQHFTGCSSSPTSSPMQQYPAFHSRHRSLSTASSSFAASTPLNNRVIASPESSTLTKEKEFMANTRILAMSNLIDSFAMSSHAKQGFYGKQLKIIGSASSSPSSTGAELELTIKVHIIENTWTTCPLLPQSTILHRWKVNYLDSQLDSESTQDDIASSLGGLKDGKNSSWVQAIAERTETISPAPSPTFEQSLARPLSTISTSSSTAQNTSQTHVAVISNALCFVANRAGDYLVQLYVHVPFVDGVGTQGIHLTQIPKCRRNFVKFRVDPPDEKSPNLQEEHTRKDGLGDIQEVEEPNMYTEGVEFNIHPQVISLEESHLNPESDEDAQFWLEVQEILIGRDELVGKLATGADSVEFDNENSGDNTQNSQNKEISDEFEIAGCFNPSSSLHISWMSRDASAFVHDVEQELTIHITGLPDQTKSSKLLRRRKDPEVSHVMDQADQDERLVEYEHLEPDDGDLIITVEDVLTLNIQKLGWKQPFMNFTIDLSDTQTNDLTLVEVTGDAVQDYERIPTESDEQIGSELESLDKESTTDNERHLPATYRVWFFPGTEGVTVVQINARVGQAVPVGYGKNISCNIPKVKVQGVNSDKGRIHIHTSNDLVIQRCDKGHLETPPLDCHSVHDDSFSTKHHHNVRFQYQSSDYQLIVIAQRYQALARIARIERINVNIGVSGQQQPGFARVLLENVVLSLQDDSYLRMYQLDGAEIWNVLVDGRPCAKSIQYMDSKSGGQHTIMIPIPEGSPDNDNLHQVEISYGFNTVDHELEEEKGNETQNTSIKLVVPGFNLPVGEYLVAANLPKLPTDMDYHELVGDFEIISTVGAPGHRKTVTYGAYMTLGRPRLSIKASKLTVATNDQQSRFTETIDTDNQRDSLEQVTRSVVAHDPQQPPFDAGHIVTQQTSQRHPQQPLDLQSPHAEQSHGGGIHSSGMGEDDSDKGRRPHFAIDEADTDTERLDPRNVLMESPVTTSSTQDLEIRPRVSNTDDHLSPEDTDDKEGSLPPSGLKKIFHLLKQLFGGEKA